MTLSMTSSPVGKSGEFAEVIRKRIDDGVYASRLPTIDTFVRETGLNNRTVIRGLALLEQEGLVKRKPSVGTFVTRLKRERTHTIGAVFGGTTAPLGAQLAAGMQVGADAARHGLTLSGYGRVTDTQFARVKDLVERSKVDGLLLWFQRVDVEREAIAYLHEQNVPFVLVPRYEPEIHKDVHTVSGAEAGATADVMTHLLGWGHREIAFAGSFNDARQAFIHHHRYEQYCHSCKIAGLTPREGLRIGDAQSAPESDRALVAALREVSAVICGTDRVAALIHRVCARHSIGVPHDLAIVGFDNSDIARWLDLTSVEQHFETIGRKAVEVLLGEIEGNLTEPVHEEVEAELVVRGSSGGRS